MFCLRDSGYKGETQIYCATCEKAVGIFEIRSEAYEVMKKMHFSETPCPHCQALIDKLGKENFDTLMAILEVKSREGS